MSDRLRKQRAKKSRVEGCISLDTFDFKRMELLVPCIARTGSLEWRSGSLPEPLSSASYTLSVGAITGMLRLTYQVKQSGEKRDYAIPMSTTNCHLGGVRWWFHCPLSKEDTSCGRRVRKLYLYDTSFGCRHCHDLTYTSVQESSSRVYAALRRGAHLHEFHDVNGLSISQLGFVLKVLIIGLKRARHISSTNVPSSKQRK